MGSELSIKYIDGVFIIAGNPVVYRDLPAYRLHCLSSLFEILDSLGINRPEWSVFVRSKSFLRRYRSIAPYKRDLLPGYVVSQLQSRGEYRREGNGRDVRIYVSFAVFLATLMEYTPELSAVTTGLFVNSIK